jgi:hypothetical protein
MKTRSKFSVLSALVLSASFAVLSASAEDSKPCKEIRAACESAGFVKGGHKEGKGLVMDCMKKLVAGEKVEGVSVSSELVSACKAKKEKHKERKGGKHEE